MNALKCAAKVFTPKFYVDYFHCVVASTRQSFIAGSVAPLFKGMLVVGVVGYTMEYTLVGRYHVMDRQKIVKEAMAHHHH